MRKFALHIIFFYLHTGYHRLWSHLSYTASLPLEIFLMIGGTGALQGSIKWWSLLHRAHHRWTDTDSDPYNHKEVFGIHMLDGYY